MKAELHGVGLQTLGCCDRSALDLYCLLIMGARVHCRTLNVPVTDIVRTGDKMVVPKEGMRKANGSKVSPSNSQWQCLAGCSTNCIAPWHKLTL